MVNRMYVHFKLDDKRRDDNLIPMPRRMRRRYPTGILLGGGFNCGVRIERVADTIHREF